MIWKNRKTHYDLSCCLSLHFLHVESASIPSATLKVKPRCKMSHRNMAFWGKRERLLKVHRLAGASDIINNGNSVLRLCQWVFLTLRINHWVTISYTLAHIFSMKETYKQQTSPKRDLTILKWAHNKPWQHPNWYGNNGHSSTLPLWSAKTKCDKSAAGLLV